MCHITRMNYSGNATTVWHINMADWIKCQFSKQSDRNYSYTAQIHPIRSLSLKTIEFNTNFRDKNYYEYYLLSLEESFICYLETSKTYDSKILYCCVGWFVLWGMLLLRQLYRDAMGLEDFRWNCALLKQ